MTTNEIIEGLGALPLIVRGSRDEVFKAVRQLQEAARRAASNGAISHCALCEDPSFIYRDCVNDAATRMRDKCVEKVREVLSGLMIELPSVSDSYLRGQGWNSAIARANNELIPALESLTLDQVEQKEAK